MRVARLADELSTEDSLEPWWRIQLRRHWRFAQLLAFRPASSPEAQALAVRGARWRATIRAMARTHRDRSQGHGRRGRWPHWNYYVKSFLAQRPSASTLSTWEDTALEDGGAWENAEDDFLRWRLHGWEGRCTVPLGKGALRGGRCRGPALAVPLLGP